MSKQLKLLNGSLLQSFLSKVLPVIAIIIMETFILYSDTYNGNLT